MEFDELVTSGALLILGFALIAIAFLVAIGAM